MVGHKVVGCFFFHKCFRKARWSWFVDGHKVGTEQIEIRRGYNFTILLFWPTLLSLNMIMSYILREPVKYYLADFFR